MAISDRITSIEEHIKESYQELEGIGIDTTKVDKNLENIPKLIDGYWETLPKVTGEGTAITLDNTKEGKMKIVLKGNTSQEGTPTPETPQDIHVVSGDNSINVVGKNLLSFANITNNTAVGITRTVNQETITLNGTTTGAGNIVAKTSTGIILKAGTYTGSITTSGSYNRPNGDVAFYLRKDNTISGMFDKSLINMTTNGQYSSTFTLTEDTEVFLEIYTNASNITFDNYVCKFQIEKGSSATTYEPYIGNTYPVNLPVENLFELPATQTINGITFTNNGNGTFNLSGTASAIADFTISKELNTIANGKFTISGKSLGYSLQMAFYNGNNWLSTPINKLPTELIKTGNVTIPSNATKYDLVIRVPSGYTVNLINETVQFEKGSKANSFTPYGTTPIELCKIGTYQDIIKKSKGINLFDKGNVTDGGFYADHYIANDSWCYVNTTELKAGQTYFTNQRAILSFNNGTTNISYIDKNNASFIVPPNTTNVYISTLITNKDTLQINEGSTALPYEPYGIGWYVKKEINKVVLNGTETWGQGNPNFRYITNITSQTIDGTIPLSNYFKGGAYSYGIILQNIDNSTIRINVYYDTIISDYQALKTWLQTHNTILYYVLATPTYTEITNSTLISQLNALARSYTSQTNISQESNDLASLLNATALSE